LGVGSESVQTPNPKPQTPTPSSSLTIAERKRILLDHIHGVDLDGQAVEVTKLNLLLKCLEGETSQTLGFEQRLFRERALPDLGKNILCGNSLIGTDIIGTDAWNKMSEEERRKIIPFDYERAFPQVLKQGGFDAVIGNPPWDRIKLQQVEWFAEREMNIARQARAADRKRMIDDLRKKGAPLWHEYLEASERAESQARVLRDSGDYPLLGGGDVNLYSLFVERAETLVAKDGLVALLTPSGIAADKGAAEFFRSISGTGRLGALFDFENKGVFFPDVHDNFKFVALVFGGQNRTFTEGAAGLLFAEIGRTGRSGARDELEPAGLPAPQPQHRGRANLPQPARRRHHPRPVPAPPSAGQAW